MTQIFYPEFFPFSVDDMHAHANSFVKNSECLLCSSLVKLEMHTLCVDTCQPSSDSYLVRASFF